MNGEITKQWETYLAKVYPQGVHPSQEQETKQAFFAGAFVTMNMMMDIACKETEAKAEIRLMGIDREIEEVLRSRCAVLRKQN